MITGKKCMGKSSIQFFLNVTWLSYTLHSNRSLNPETHWVARNLGLQSHLHTFE